MPLFLELRNGHSGHTGFDLPSGAPGELGPLLGPFIAVRLIRDEVRVTTLEWEFPLERVADWIFYAGKFYPTPRLCLWNRWAQAATAGGGPLIPPWPQSTVT